MFDTSAIGRLLVTMGIFLTVIGLFLLFGGRFLPLGRLPGDIAIRKGNFAFYFPLASSILISLILTLLLRLLRR
ncbi:MAG: DUF2905 domain-containing protein [Firmicutes bacterium]|jgi:hypothetical protein|nr:DUF2905 domain-containing protein [Bacillota bacterium]